MNRNKNLRGFTLKNEVKPRIRKIKTVSYLLLTDGLMIISSQIIVEKIAKVANYLN